VVTTDIPGAFMHANIDELAHILFEGTLTELLSLKALVEWGFEVNRYEACESNKNIKGT
jgi:hypothetical protein